MNRLRYDNDGPLFERDIGGMLFSGLFDCVAGPFIGEGCQRRVYETNELFATPMVIKIAREDGKYQNMAEYETWITAKDSKNAKWLAPVHYVADNGSVLIMARTSPVSETDRMPRRVPSFLTDLKRDNWGWLDGRLVCHDYGINNSVDLGVVQPMKAALWHD